MAVVACVVVDEVKQHGSQGRIAAPGLDPKGLVQRVDLLLDLAGPISESHAWNASLRLEPCAS